MLTFNKRLSCWECRWLFRNREIRLTLDFPADTSSSVIETQRVEALAKIEQLWPQIEERLGSQGLELFNENWGPAGDLPSLSRDEFLARVLLESINVDDDGDMELFFSDSDLFAGHFIEFYCRSDGEITGPNLFG